MKKTLIVKLSETTYKKLVKKKEEVFPQGADWEEFFNYLVKDVHLEELGGERISRSTKEHLFELWVRNFADNLPYIREGKTIADLVPPEPEKVPKSAGIVVGAGPSIWKHKHLEMLAESDFDGKVILCDRMTIPALKAGVTPEKFDIYIVGVDGAPIIAKWYDDPIVDKYGPDLKVCIITSTHPDVRKRLEKAGAQIYWFNPIFDDWRRNESFTKLQLIMTKSEKLPKGVPSMSALGHAGGCAWVMAHSLLRCSPICLSEDTLIYTNPRGPVKISEVNIGEEVLSFSESGLIKGRITNKIFSGIKEILEIRTATRKIEVSRDHRILTVTRLPKPYFKLRSEGYKVIKSKVKELGWTLSDLAKKTNIPVSTLRQFLCGRKGMNKNRVQRICEILNLDPTNKILKVYFTRKNQAVKCYETRLVWKRAEELKQGDLIVILKKARVKDHCNCLLPNGWKSTPELMQLIGAFLGDGYLRIRKARRGGHSGEVVWSLVSRKEVIEAYKQLITKVFKRRPSVDKKGLVLYSLEVARAFKELGLYSKSPKRELPKWIFSLCRNCKAALLCGFLDSDGNRGKDRKYVFPTFGCTSKKMIEQLRYIAIELGLRVSNIKTDTHTVSLKGKNYVTTQWLFKCNFSEREKKVLSRSVKLRREELPKLSRRARNYMYERINCKLPSEFAIDRIRKIRRIGKKATWEIQTTTNNYIAEGIVTHNCLLGLNLGWDADTPLEKTQYFSTFLAQTGGNVELARAAFKKIYNPYWKCEAIVDPVFNHYREAFLEAVKMTEPWVITVNCTGGGCLFGEGIYCMNFEDFLKYYKDVEELKKHFLKAD